MCEQNGLEPLLGGLQQRIATMFKEPRTELKFNWSHLGDIAQGRPHLGPKTSVAVYRLMQFTIRDAMIKHTDPETATKVFYEAGHMAGRSLYENLLDDPKDFNELVSRLEKLLKELSVGILRFERTDLEKLDFVLTVAEDLDCSGLPLMDEAVCTFDEGFIAGLLKAFTGKEFDVKEVDCWATGERVCRFSATVQ